MTTPAQRQRLTQVFTIALFLGVSLLLGLLAWRLTPPEGPPLKRTRRGLPRAQMPDDVNLVLITIDGLRTDRLGSYGEAPLSPAPHIDRLVSEGFRFEQAITPVPTSFPAHAALMTGLSPLGRREILDMGGGLPEEQATLAEILRSSGFRTAAFVGSAAVGRATGLARGFDRFDEPASAEWPATARFLARRGSREVMGAARDWLDENFRTRFFLWVQMADPLPPQTPVPARPLGRERLGYDAEVEACDAEIGRLLARLSSLGVLGHTLVAFASVHGAGLGEHGESGAGLLLHDTTIRVPMALRLPGVGARDRSIPEQVRLFDLAPTLLDLLRLAPPAPADGVSLVPLLDPGGDLPALSAAAVAPMPRQFLGGAPIQALRSRGYKLIDGPVEGLFDLRSDPKELRNQAGSQHGRVVEMRRLLKDSIPEPDLTAAPAAGTAPFPPAAMNLIEAGMAALRASDSARARRDLEDLKRLLEASGGERAPAGLLALLGAAHKMQGRSTEALALYQEAFASLDPETPLGGLLQAEIGSCLLLARNNEAALEAFRSAVALRPADIEVRLSLALLLTEMGQAGFAIEELRAAQARSPGDATILAAMGRALLADGQPSAALLSLQDALRTAPWLLRPWFDLAQVYEALGRPADALRAYQDYLVRSTSPSDALREQAADRLRLLQQPS